MNDWTLKNLPPAQDVETKNIFRALNKATRKLAELKGVTVSIPNKDILINTLGLQESKYSSEIENIITTQDDLFRASVDSSFDNIEAKKVLNYTDALKKGYQLVEKNKLLTSNHIKEIQRTLEPNKPDFRKLIGTVLKNNDGEVIYTPPQNYDQIVELMSNLDKYINNNEFQDIDPLIKMPIIHFQFESIHPFLDGNGRTGRIINVLYLVQQGLLDIPVLYLSRYINQNKIEYYKHLQQIRRTNNYEDWIVWMLNGVAETAENTINTIQEIKELMADYKHRIRKNHSFYSQDLINNLFKHPYTKIEFVARDLDISRQTAATYLNRLTENKLIIKIKKGRSNYYMNMPLFNLLQNVNSNEIKNIDQNNDLHTVEEYLK